MVILKNNFNLAQIVKENAQFQKVMLIYDNNVSSSQINDSYNAISKICIFNKMNVNALDLNEIYNGYKLIIYMCDVMSFLNLNFEKADFCNVFIPQDNCLLPYFLTEGNNYLLLTSALPDIAIFSSINFNFFYNFLNCLINQQNVLLPTIGKMCITQDGLIEGLKHYTDLPFVDLEILKEIKLNYKYLPAVDYLLICALNVTINAILEEHVGFVDFYKEIKDDSELINKFYALTNNNILIATIKYNSSALKLAMKNVLDNVSFLKEVLCLKKEEIDYILGLLKNYTKNCNNFLAYLYIYDVFG